MNAFIGNRVRGINGHVGTIVAVRSARFIEVLIEWDEFPAQTWESTCRLRGVDA